MKLIIFSLLFFSITALLTVSADNNEKIDSTVAHLLFDEGLSEVSSYKVRSDGLVDIVFPSDMPNEVYSEILNQLKNNEAIPAVLAGKGGQACGLW